MAQWVGYLYQGQHGFGLLDGNSIEVYEGDFFSNPRNSGARLALADVQISLPCRPGKFIGLWNNYHAQAAKQGLALPADPLYFIKASSSYCAHDCSPLPL